MDQVTTVDNYLHLKPEVNFWDQSFDRNIYDKQSMTR